MAPKWQSWDQIQAVGWPLAHRKSHGWSCTQQIMYLRSWETSETLSCTDTAHDSTTAGANKCLSDTRLRGGGLHPCAHQGPWEQPPGTAGAHLSTWDFSVEPFCLVALMPFSLNCTQCLVSSFVAETKHKILTCKSFFVFHSSYQITIDFVALF